MKEQEKSKIIEIIEWIKENRKPFFTTLLSVVIVALVVVFVCVRIHLIDVAASDKLDMAKLEKYMALFKNEANIGDALLREVF